VTNDEYEALIEAAYAYLQQQQAQRKAEISHGERLKRGCGRTTGCSGTPIDPPPMMVVPAVPTYGSSDGRLQPTALGAQDRGHFNAILCCAPSAAAETQAVGPLVVSWDYDWRRSLWTQQPGAAPY